MTIKTELGPRTAWSRQFIASIEPDDFESKGSLGKAHQLFGTELPKILEELNEVLVS